MTARSLAVWALGFGAGGLYPVRVTDTTAPPASVDERVAAFTHRRDEIVGRRCAV